MNHISSSFPPPEWTILQFLCICSSDAFNGHMGAVNCLCNVRKSSSPNRSFSFDAGAAHLKRKTSWDVSLIKASNPLNSKSQMRSSAGLHSEGSMSCTFKVAGIWCSVHCVVNRSQRASSAARNILFM